MSGRRRGWPQPERGRLAALLILAALPLLLYLVLIAPIVAWVADARTAHERLQARLAEYRRVAAIREPLAQRVAALGRDPARQRHYLPGTRRALASAALQQRITTLVESGRGQLISTQSGAGTPEDDRVRLRVHMRGGIAELVDLFHGIENGTPILFLENVAIGALQTRLSRNAPEAPPLDIRFDVVGYSAGEQ